jgi:hypothetical protein
VHGGYVSKYPSVPSPQKPAQLAANTTAKNTAAKNTDAPKDANDVKPAAPVPAAEAPKDIVDIVFSEPIRVKIKPAPAK